MTKVKETPGIMMKTVIEIHPSVMDYKGFPKALGLKDPQREPLYPKTRTENLPRSVSKSPKTKNNNVETDFFCFLSENAEAQYPIISL